MGCETSTDVDAGRIHTFIGYIDRLDRDDATGEITVVDYKTGAIAKSAGEYLTEVLAFREFQLPFYYWARTAAGDRVTRLSLVPLKDALLDVEPVELTVVVRRPPQNGRRNAATASIAIADLEKARERMIAIAATLATPTIAQLPRCPTIRAPAGTAPTATRAANARPWRKSDSGGDARARRSRTRASGRHRSRPI